MELRVLTVLLLAGFCTNGSCQQFHRDRRNVPADQTETTPTVVFPEVTAGLKGPPYTSFAVKHRCSLLPENASITSDILKAVNDGMTMLKFELKFRGKEELPVNSTGSDTSNMFKPFFWIRTTDRFGTRLLLLKPNYGIMSFRSLEMQVEEFKNIRLTEYPENCMDGLQYDQIEQMIRELVMANFQNTSIAGADLDETDNVCNLHITNDDGAEFRYYCCQRKGNTTISCGYLEPDLWLTLMRFVIRVIKFCVIFFCPLLIPKSFFHKLSDSDSFKYKLDKTYRIVLKLVKRPKRSRMENKHLADEEGDDGSTIRVNLSELRGMKTFKKRVQELPLDQPKMFGVNVAELQTEGKRLVNPGEAPSRIFQNIYEFVFNCRVREMKSMESCCNADICRLTPCVFTWYNCARILMRIVLGMLIITPWVIRSLVYFEYEHGEMTMRKQAAQDKGYVFAYPGNFTWYMTPLHTVFIFIYCFLFLETLIYNYIGTKTKDKLQFLFRKCNRDMRADSRTKAFGKCMQLLLLPFTSLGCWVLPFGIFMWIVLVPIAAVYLVYHLLPLVNLTFRMFIHIIVYAIPVNVKKDEQNLEERDTTDGISDKTFKQKIKAEYLNLRKIIGDNSLMDDDERIQGSYKKRFIQAIVILMCLITTYSCMGLLFEMTTFFLDVFIYTLIGCILYADDTMTYISLGVLLMVYGQDCFGSVPAQFSKYSATINSYMMSLCEKQAMPVLYQRSNDQRNRAFAVLPCSSEDDPCESEGLVVPDHKDVRMTYDSNNLTWNVRKVVFFLTGKDIPMLPSKLLFEAGVMPYANKPGRLLHLYLKAVLNFSWIVGFLIFVLLVVLAFGESGSISMSNQLLATIAGGILPFLLRKFVFTESSLPEIDAENDMYFRVAMHDLINFYDQNWPIHDIDTVELSDTLLEEKALTNGHVKSESVTDESVKEGTPLTNGHIQSLSKEESVKEETPLTNGHVKSESLIEETTLTNGSITLSKASELDYSNELETIDGVKVITNEPLDIVNERKAATTTIYESCHVTKVIIEFSDSDLDKHDFPILYNRISPKANLQTVDGEDVPLTVKVETA